MRLRCLITGFTIITFGLILYFAVRQRPEPVYAGKTVDQWLDAGQEDVSLALQEIGPPALPYILAKLKREDPQCGTANRYRWFWTKIPICFRAVLPKPWPTTFDETRACSALLELGPTTIANLGRGLECNNPAIRRASVEALCRWRERGKDLSAAARYLQAALHDSDPRIAGAASRALGSASISNDE